MRRPFGRLLLAVGDNEATVALAGASVWWLRTRAFVLSSLCATIAAVVLVGFAGSYPTVGQGYQYTAIAAAVVGGVVLGGGRGWVLSAAAGALVLECLVSVLNASGVSSTWRDTVQGLLILAAVSVTVLRVPARLRRRTHSGSAPSGATPSSSDASTAEAGPRVPKGI
jgi:ribose transport system permease protein